MSERAPSVGFLARVRRWLGARRAAAATGPPGAGDWERLCSYPMAPVRALSHPVARAVAALTAPGDVVLEAGCGTGALSAELAAAGRTVEVCDWSPQLLERAVELFRASGLPEPRAVACDLTRPLPWPDGAVDVVWSSGVLEHWTDEELGPILAEMARISRKSVIALVPSAECVFYRLGKDLAEAKGRWPYGREMPRASLRAVFEAAGLRNVRESRVWPEWGPKFLERVDARLFRVVDRWWASLPPEDPVKARQGYLLLAVGHSPRRREEAAQEA